MAAWAETSNGTVYIVRTACTTEDGAIRNLLRKLEQLGCIELRVLDAGREVPEFTEYTEL